MSRTTIMARVSLYETCTTHRDSHRESACPAIADMSVAFLTRRRLQGPTYRMGVDSACAVLQVSMIIFYQYPYRVTQCVFFLLPLEAAALLHTCPCQVCSIGLDGARLLY
ncbi:uncharacterized protein K452DRAFT_142677 [Aplosporella prunicola CBS 121167]|uniref:Uncharacterized protein n=1 Tax=Aplosporella prunicola CBS 121167 TaxID=1176127 RepID=A0A6A6BK27_9PEZI|nr:uncharacterized protein K452DRAFT_142677 [Aplosporella prunicola CBS 121167]KAF2144490.1 hypothetical protein K452DRAFT_142677 [Aplosporella prunicola CBS 121167]